MTAIGRAAVAAIFSITLAGCSGGAAPAATPAAPAAAPVAPTAPTTSASKASSDHLVQAWHHTYGLPIVISNCSNNYGPRQHLEKVVPRFL